jgi:glycerol-3-phosphate dehydrogenase
VDVLVVGGGVVGAGIARDAAMRGLSVALAERNDFAFGASSRSSRLLHGGLRYLAQGRLRLVREAAVEKMILGRIAPHLTRPTPFVFPTYRGTPWKLWKLRIGVKIYDRLAGRRNFGASRGMGPGEAIMRVPGLRGDHLTGAVRYFDAVTFDARLVIDTLRSAASHGARLFNYLSFESADRRGDVWHCRLDDRLARRSVELTARTVVNAAGASADRFPQSRVQLRLTKGVHLVIPRQRLPVPEAVVMTEGQRILFAIPWGERVILGTTDTDYAGDVESPTCEPEDVRYILDVANRTFPAAALSRADVVSTWAGLRPLIASSAGGPSDISRAHHIGMTEPGWLDVAGGKLTTYRLIAEQTVDRVVALLGATAGPCTTRDEPLIPDDASRAFSGVLPPEVSCEAVEHFCRREWAVHLDDVMVRRTGWQHYHDNDADVARRACGWMAEALGWSPEYARAEYGRYGALMQQSRGCIEER